MAINKAPQTKVYKPQGAAYLVIGTDATGRECIITAGAATDDASIVTAIGADANWADGSIYIGLTATGGKLWLKTNDVWIDEKL